MMKNPTPRNLSLIVAACMTVLSALLMYVFLSVSNFHLRPLVWIAFFIIFFSASAFLVYYALETLIYRKIKLVYKAISTIKSPKDRGTFPIQMNKDIISEVNNEVEEWVQHRKEEIEQLKKLETFRREFLGNVSHELKTPIFNIQGYIHTLLDGGVNDSEINLLYLDKASRSVDRLCAIVDDLEAISKLETGELILEPYVFDIHELTKEVFESIALKANTKNISLSFKEGCDIPFYVLADKDRIRQVLVNLIVNSIKYGKQDGRTQVGFYDMDKNILVEISDNGIGIEEKHLPRLFERFYRVDKSRSREQGGTGLGLAIVKHIIEAHQQQINVRSTFGTGSTFGFTLPKP